MTQELMELRQSILEGRYDDALEIVDDLEDMSKQGTLRKIEAFLVRLVIHLIKNQIEQRLINSWIASISDSVIQIAKLNIKDNQKSYYIKSDEWGEYLAEAVEMAIRPASAEIFGGTLKSSQVSQRLNREELIDFAENLLLLTYEYQPKELAKMIDNYLAELPGGEDWFE
ncbi:DUF29 family protein [Dolichospermum sp. ST_con]|nr:DUF29 family protein [Dolichospermum sp. ST_con]MDD1419519.1 DUF29 family protein [Dolichospermum sp. ST_sed1]MDD1424133.1 DUF29 family protein [Dolichospermum sp. ST_sed9]MDD1430604.1 DUF29 family protein [Dolichospermum sp. ST_sed6]MDD1435013.1 DUF29 family protein [Dolichospermum sp. ST_sed10]MDD1439941.1 DUF29 family protein [Dolichospermum sp. ST_sed3]MDD1445877.1 DUF29 family protein [Dolichospermum sp. ST_sed8]MDD1454502.1 DUF29 family protein [Dolichospermum sp. ST_sed7]MDD145872